MITVLIKHDNELRESHERKKLCCLKMLECISQGSCTLYVLRAAFNGFLKTAGSFDFQDIRQKVVAEQRAKTSDCGKHKAELLDFSTITVC